MRATTLQEVNIYLSKEKMLLSGISSLWILPLALLLSLGSGSCLVQSVCVCVCLCDTEVKSVDRDNKQ